MPEESHKFCFLVFSIEPSSHFDTRHQNERRGSQFAEETKRQGISTERPEPFKHCMLESVARSNPNHHQIMFGLLF